MSRVVSSSSAKARPTAIVAGAASASPDVQSIDDSLLHQDGNQDTADSTVLGDQGGDANDASMIDNGDAAEGSQAEYQAEPEDDDPDLLASYPIYLSNSLPSTSSLQLFQYPTYPRRQPLPLPSNSRERGLTQSIRWRPQAGWVQVELPLDLRKSLYSKDKGAEMGRGAEAMGGEIGDARSGRSIKSEPIDADDDPLGRSSSSSRKRQKKPAVESDEEDDVNAALNGGHKARRLEKIRLESDVMPQLTRYCVGVIRDKALHLTQLDGIVQLRPSLHHLDGVDQLEAEEKKHKASRAAMAEGGGPSSGIDTDEEGGGLSDGGANSRKKQPASRAYTVSVKVAGGDMPGKGPGGKGGFGGGGGGGGSGIDPKEQLMASRRAAEAEEWVDLKWRDAWGSHKEEVKNTLENQLFAGSKTKLHCLTRPREFLP